MTSGPILLTRPGNRLAGFGITLLVHATLIALWQMARQPDLPAAGEVGYVHWLRLPPPAEAEPAASHAPPRPAPRQIGRAALAASPIAESAPPEPAPAAPETPDAPPVPGGARALIESARMAAGAIDRDLRKQSKPTIVAPPDSPHIRMANKFNEAAALAPNKWWEAPKIVELVNDGGDGARRFRVLTAAGIYCITERSPATSIDMIEKHGRQRITNCGHEHEQPAKPQQWRTARD